MCELHELIVGIFFLSANLTAAILIAGLTAAAVGHWWPKAESYTAGGMFVPALLLCCWLTAKTVDDALRTENEKRTEQARGE